jgi:hypothetical protein
MSTTKINDVKIRTLPNDEKDTRPIKGAEMFPLLCAIIYMFAKKGRGKTTVVYNILEACCGPETIIVVFTPTYWICKTWRGIREWANKEEHPVLHYTGFKDENGNDNLKMLTDILKLPVEERCQLLFGNNEEKSDGNSGEEVKNDHPFAGAWADFCSAPPVGPGEKNKKKKRVLTPGEKWLRFRAKLPHQPLDFIFVMDDMGKGLRSDSFATFMKQQRHFNCKIIISGHNLKDIQPDQREMVDYWLLFEGIQKKKLEEIYEATRVGIPYPIFAEKYEEATPGKNDWLYVDNERDELRKKFDERFNVAKFK